MKLVPVSFVDLAVKTANKMAWRWHGGVARIVVEAGHHIPITSITFGYWRNFPNGNNPLSNSPSECPIYFKLSSSFQPYLTQTTRSRVEDPQASSPSDPMDPHVAGILRGGNAPKESFVPRLLVPINEGWIGAHHQIWDENQQIGCPKLLGTPARTSLSYLPTYQGCRISVVYTNWSSWTWSSKMLSHLLVPIEDNLLLGGTKMDSCEWHDHLPTWFSGLVASWRTKSLSFAMCPEIR